MTEPYVIYLAAPEAARNTDRYEQFYYLLAHRFPRAEILEAKELFPTQKAWVEGWEAILARCDTLVFIRNEARAVGHGTWREVCEARDAGKTVYLARMDRDGSLVLIPWEELTITIDKEKSRRNYAAIRYARRPLAEVRV
jgi:hypothetical protein